MNSKQDAEHHKANAERYLRDTAYIYALNSKSGLYQQNSWNADDATHYDPPEHVDSQRPKGSAADWTAAIISMFGMVISVLTLIGLGVTAWFSIKQWTEAHRTADASMSSVSVAEQARMDYKTAADESNKSSYRQSQLDERAWLGFTDQSIAPKDGLVTATAICRIFGKTPAVEIRTRANAIYRAGSLSPTIKELVYERPAIQQGSGVPGGSFPVMFYEIPPAFTQEPVYGQMQKGLGNIYFFGEARYKDIFHSEHWTHFCVTLDKLQPQGHPCGFYNDSDADYKHSN